MKISALATIAMAIGLATASTIPATPQQSGSDDTLVQAFGIPRFHTNAVREDSYDEATTIPKSFNIDVAPKSTEHQGRPSILVHGDPSTAADREPYVWDFETYSQDNYYGDRQRFNGDGCVNFHCIEVRGYKGLTDKEYIFYDGDDCYGAVILRTTDKMMDKIKQPFKPCSIRVQYPSNYKGWGNPPSGKDLVLYGQPWYKGSSSASLSGKQCHDLKGQGVLSFKGKADQTYTFYRDAGCKGQVLETSKGPNSRTNTYMVPQSVKIE